MLQEGHFTLSRLELLCCISPRNLILKLEKGIVSSYRGLIRVWGWGYKINLSTVSYVNQSPELLCSCPSLNLLYYWSSTALHCLPWKL